MWLQLFQINLALKFGVDLYLLDCGENLHCEKPCLMLRAYISINVLLDMKRNKKIIKANTCQIQSRCKKSAAANRIFQNWIHFKCFLWAGKRAAFILCSRNQSIVKITGWT